LSETLLRYAELFAAAAQPGGNMHDETKIAYWRSGGRSRPRSSDLVQLALIISRTSWFHSACDKWTVFSRSPIVMPWSVISTSGQAVQAGHN
jgi:hypothetical protein